MFDKVVFVTKNKLMYIQNDDLINKCLDSDYLVSYLAKKELIRRYPIETSLSDDILFKVINKLELEQIWEIVSKDVNNRLGQLALMRFDKIYEYSKSIYREDFYNKVNEDNKTIRLIK